MFGHVGHRMSVRASSVPVEPLRVLDTHGASTARRISNAALDDTDAMLAASKRHDQQLLRDINTRLANQSLQRPNVTVTKRSSGPRKPPLPPTGRPSGLTTLYTTTSSTSSGVPPRRSAASRYSTSDYDEDIDMMPPTPVTRSVIRASSVPPRLPASTRTSVSSSSGYTVNHVPASVTGGRYLMTSKILPPPPTTTLNGPKCGTGYWAVPYYNGVTYSTDSTERGLADLHDGYLATRVTNPPGHIGPVADLAIRQAHRNLDRIDRELKQPPNEHQSNYSHQYLPRSYVEASPDHHAVHSRSYYHPSPHVITPSPSRSVRIRHASLSPVRGTTASSSSYQRHVVPSSYRAVSPVRPSELIALASGSSRSRTLPFSVEREIAASIAPKLSNEIVEMQLFPTEMYRTRTLPPLKSSYTSNNYSPALHYVSSSPSPIKRHFDMDLSSTPQPSSNVRPKMSDTRRKVRDVLCKVKKDPHYFD